MRRSLLPQRPAFMRPADRPATPPTAGAGPAPTGSAAPSRPGPAAPAGRAISLPLPAVIALLVIFLLMGVVLVLGATGNISIFAAATPTVTFTATTLPTFTPAPTATDTPAPTPTPLPPLDYVVVANDTCISIAFRNNISLQTLLDANGLPQACPLSVGQKLSIPQPSPTPTAPPTNTLEPPALTETARPRATYAVVAGDTLFSIAGQFNVDYNALAQQNGIPGPDYAITVGQVLIVPLDRQPPTAGPSPTATALPPYPAPVLLGPPNGAAITAVEQTVILQWSAVDVLQQNEAYLVTVEDLTCNCARRKLETTIETRYIVSVDMKPAETKPHIFKWTVVTVRQTGTTDSGRPIYEPAGATSEERTFTWAGIGVPVTPSP
nr:LysM peptidoglycan-binding domain-containing protein [Chloroflexota bacterium]